MPISSCKSILVLNLLKEQVLTYQCLQVIAKNTEQDPSRRIDSISLENCNNITVAKDMTPIQRPSMAAGGAGVGKFGELESSQNGRIARLLRLREAKHDVMQL